MSHIEKSNLAVLQGQTNSNATGNASTEPLEASEQKCSTKVLHVDLDKIVAIPMSESELLSGGFAYDFKACDMLATNTDKYHELSKVIDLPAIDESLTAQFVIDRFFDFVSYNGLSLSKDSCAVIFEQLPQLNGNVIQVVLKDVECWIEDWDEKSLSDMVCELGIEDDGLSTDELIEKVYDLVEELDDVAYIDTFGEGTDKRWLHKGELN